MRKVKSIVRKKKSLKELRISVYEEEISLENVNLGFLKRHMRWVLW